MFRFLWLPFIALLLSACASLTSDSRLEAQDESADLPMLSQAPELEGSTWLNSPEALRLADLRGRVVLVEMWTFG